MADKIHPIMQDIPRGVAGRFLKQQSAPKAQFQRPEKIRAARRLDYDPAAPGKKILVGALEDKLIGIADEAHMLTVAGSRSGKSLHVIANLLHYRGSVLATDPKGELANITAERRAALGQAVHVLDPFGYCAERLKGFRAAYNPMKVLSWGSPTFIEDASLIAEALVVKAQGNKDAHWDESAQNFIEGVILHVATYPAHKDESHLITVRELIKAAMMPHPDSTEEDPLCDLERHMLENAHFLKNHPLMKDVAGAIEGAARDFYEKSDRERDSVLSVVRRHTKFLDYTAMRGVLTGHDFDLSDLKTGKDGVTVYMCFPATRVEMSNRWLRIFINQLLDAMEREKTKTEAPVLVCLDEFPVLGYMKQLENAIGQVASFGVKLWVILQDWNQGKALYKERWESFAANAGIMQFFGINDLTTAEYVSKKLGKTQIKVARESEVGPEAQTHGLSGQSEAIELHDLMSPEEISRFFSRNDVKKRQLVIWTGKHPMVLERVEYFNAQSPLHGHFKGLYALPE
ncbi:MAG: TRAG family protein [Halioglobus sp.]|nr:TRAG family protein [Halioglobus sp.]|tara:strand:- start:14021 stop:15565 length:1545 start_codon:yes stop_codon:yes gene_type:complete